MTGSDRNWSPDVGSWSSGSQTSLTSFCRYFYFLWEFSFRSVFYFRFYTYYLASMRSWPGYHGGGRSCTWTGHGGCRSGFPGRRNGIRLARQVGATYVTELDLNPFLLGLQQLLILTDLGKFAQTGEAREWLFTVTASLKTTGFLWGNVGINRGNFTLNVGILPVKSKKYSLRNAVFTVNVKIHRKR